MKVIYNDIEKRIEYWLTGMEIQDMKRYGAPDLVPMASRLDCDWHFMFSLDYPESHHME